MRTQPLSPVGTVEDAAALLNIGRTLAYQEAKAGRLPGVVRIGRLYRVSLPALYGHLGLTWPPAVTGATIRPPDDADDEVPSATHRGRSEHAS